jgi:AcrR family transcriptional regulator
MYGYSFALSRGSVASTECLVNQSVRASGCAVVDKLVMTHYLEVMRQAGRVRMSAEERREQVLEAALGQFAGISQPYLFRLFPTKKALFLALVERCFRRVEEAFTVAAGDAVGEEALAAMGEAYHKLLEDRTLLLLQMQAYAASDDPEIRAATRAGYKKLWNLVERLTGLPFEPVMEFFAMGMLMNVAAALDLPAVDERWTH